MIRIVPAFLLAAPLLMLGACASSSYYDEPTYSERAAAARLASQGDYYEDQAIASKVAAALTAEPRFRNADIHVSVSDDMITLSGYVNNGSDIGRAEDIALSVPGVRAVTNALVLK
jgi:osmotically-inducible protein OsmY